MVSYLKSKMIVIGDSEKVAAMQAYMKTTQPFYGVQAVPLRKIFKEAVKKFPISSRREYEEVILELWNGKYREEMYQAMEVAARYRKYHDERSWQLCEHLVHSAPNWDTLDFIAGKLISPLILQNRKLEQVLIKWSNADNFWVRRASLLAHLRHRSETNTKLLSRTILKLAHEKEFFIRKAIGWILRDYSYANPEWVKDFVGEHQDKLSGLSKREALKRINRMSKS